MIFNQYLSRVVSLTAQSFARLLKKSLVAFVEAGPVVGAAFLLYMTRKGAFHHSHA